MTQTTNEILQSICQGRPDLLALGIRFNDEVEKAGRKAEAVDDLNTSVAAIFDLEGIPLSAEELHMVEAMDQLAWTDEQAIEFLQKMGEA